MKQLREQKLSEYYRHLETNLQSMFSRSDEILSWYDGIFFWSDEIFDEKHEYLKKIGYERVRLSEDTKVLKEATNNIS